MMKKIFLSVVIPAYNEEENLNTGVLGQIENYLKKQNYSYEVLIIDDGSSDNTVKMVEEQIKNRPGFSLVRNPHGGKAITVMTGLMRSKGEIALFTDMDQATPIQEVEKFIPMFDLGYDIVIAVRQGRKGAPLIRKLMGWGYPIVRQLVLGLSFVDTQCGFKAFNKKSRDTVFPSLLESWKKMRAAGAAVNAGFDVETLFIASKKGFKVAEVLVNWRHVGTERVQAISDSVEALKDMVRIKLNDISGKYD